MAGVPSLAELINVTCCADAAFVSTERDAERQRE